MSQPSRASEDSILACLARHFPATHPSLLLGRGDDCAVLKAGTPLCVTVDFQTVGDESTPADNCVTVRDRDTMEQVRIPIAELKNYIAEKCAF